MKLITVCIVEDHLPTCTLISKIIQEDQHLACTAVFTDGGQALKGLTELRPDVVLVDLSLPTVDGIALIRQLKPVMPLTQFMVLTLCDEGECVFEALRAGATGYLMKGSSDHQLNNAIRELHQGGSPLSSAIARKVLTNFYKPPVSSENKLPDGLTKREQQVLELMAKGHNYKAVAAQLFISSSTVRKHIFNLYEKLQVNSKTAAINKYFSRDQ
jgi:DNA-binding NarL/FixJ family response regulator